MTIDGEIFFDKNVSPSIFFHYILAYSIRFQTFGRLLFQITVFSFVMILDTLDCFLGKQTITDKILEYFGNEEIWEMFRHCRCWADVNEYVASNPLKTN
jgi:hypothetical protein